MKSNETSLHVSISTSHQASNNTSHHQSNKISLHESNNISCLESSNTSLLVASKNINSNFKDDVDDFCQAEQQFVDDVMSRVVDKTIVFDLWQVSLAKNHRDWLNNYLKLNVESLTQMKC